MLRLCYDDVRQGISPNLHPIGPKTWRLGDLDSFTTMHHVVTLGFAALQFLNNIYIYHILTFSLRLGENIILFYI